MHGKQLILLRSCNDTMFACAPPHRMSLGVPSAFLPLLHASLMHYSLPLANWLTRHDYELYGKNDLRFLEGLYKVCLLSLFPRPSFSISFVHPCFLLPIPSFPSSFVASLILPFFPLFLFFSLLSFVSFISSPSGVTRRVPLPPTADERTVSLHRVC